MSVSADLKNVFKENQNVVLVCKKKNPDDTLMDLCESVSKKFKKICVVTVNKPISLIVRKMKDRKIDYSNIYFVDCISSSLMEKVPVKQGISISSPKALTELAIVLNSLPSDIELVIIDSFSGLVFYNDLFLTVRFMNSITSKFRKKMIKSIYLVAGETKSESISDLALFTDETIVV